MEPVLALAARKSVPIHGWTWIYLVGGAALFLFGLQIATGCLLMIYYQPTEAAAHESVTRIMTAVPYGWLLRSLHVWTADMLVATVLLHFVTVLLSRAYRRPRELTWITGVLLLLLTLTLGFSGYLLPWNQRSYVATLVGTQIPGCLPRLGQVVVELLRGGKEVSGDTLTRFYAAHVVIVPIFLVAIAVVHLGLVQLHGMSLPSALSMSDVRDQEPFFSEYLLRDACVWLVLFGTLITLAVLAPADIGAKADRLQPAPTGIRPEWYFLWMYQVLKHVPERAGVAGLTVGFLLLLALPLLDGHPASSRHNRVRTALFVISLAAIAVLHIAAWIAPETAHRHPPLVADTYRPGANVVCLLLLWTVVAFLAYYLQRLRQHNRRIRLLYNQGVRDELT